MAYEINEQTKQQLNHLGEVVTGKANGAPTGSDIATSTLPYTGQVRRTIPEIERLALESFRLGAGNKQGDYAIGVVFEEANWTYTYNGQQWGLRSTFDLSTLPYTATQADPNNDGNLEARGEASKEYVDTEIENLETSLQGEIATSQSTLRGEITDAQEELLPPGSQIYPESDTLSNGMTVPSGTTHLRVPVGGSPSIFTIKPVTSSKVVSSIDTALMKVTFSDESERVLSSIDNFKIDSTDDFQHLSPPVNVFFETRSYYPDWSVLEGSPRGSALYVTKPASTTVRAYGDHVCANGVVAQLVNEGELNIEKYGVIAGRTNLLVRIHSAFQNHKSIYAPSLGGEYEIDSVTEGKLTFTDGLSLRGDDSQTYGEFENSAPTTFRFIGTTDFTMEFPTGGRPLKLKNINFEGDWANDGLEHLASTREITWENVSFKKFRDGMKTDDGYVVRWDTVTFTCRRTGISWGGGTTLIWDNVGIQGDKESLTRIQVGMEFADGSAPVLSNSRISGFCQYALTAVKVSGSQQLKFDSFDFEDVSDNLFDIGTGFRLNLTLDNCYLGINDGGKFFNVTGALGDASRIKIGAATGRDKHFGNNAVLDWSTEDFIYMDAGGSIGSEASILIDENVYVRVADGIDSSIGSSIFLAATDDSLYADCIIVVGSKSIPIDWLSRLYRGASLFDGGAYSRVGRAQANFSNGMTYTIGSQILTAGADQNQPIRSIVSLRSAATAYFNKVDTVVGVNTAEAINVTFDAIGGTLDFVAGSASQRFVITIN